MQSFKILIVDDYDDNRMLLGQIVKLLNCVPSLANNGKTALEILTKEDIDLVLMDIEMPVLNGIEATSEIRKMKFPKNQIPVIAITAHPAESISEKLEKIGFNDFLTKPYTIAKLKIHIQKYLE